jgi:hypothetical protein
MAPRLKAPIGLSIADKGKRQETIIVLETLIDINLLDLGSRTLNNRNRSNTTFNNT